MRNASVIGRVRRHLDLAEQHHAGVSDAESDDAAGDRDEQALGHQLAHEPSASGADRQAQRHFARARGRAARQQSGDVGARDEQHARARASRASRSASRPADLPRCAPAARCGRRAGGSCSCPDRRARGPCRSSSARSAPAACDTPGVEPALQRQVARVAGLERRRPSDRDQHARHHETARRSRSGRTGPGR